MIEFHRLSSTQSPLFNEAFRLYESSFPTHEQRLIGKQDALMSHPLYHFDVILDDGVFSGILLYWLLSGCTYIEHFAIQTQVRGNALGTRSLEAFCKEHPLTVLEIDPPADAVSIRREGFYQRLGFSPNPYPHTHPAYQFQFSPHQLVVMSYPHTLTEEEYHLFSRQLQDIVMQDAD